MSRRDLDANIRGCISIEVDTSGIIDAVAAAHNPEDIFPGDELDKWAETHGYVSKEDTSFLDDWARGNGYILEDEAVAYCVENNKVMSVLWEKVKG